MPRSAHPRSETPTSGGPDLMRLYLDEIGRTPLLTAAEEAELGALVQAGLAARQELARHGVTPSAGLVTAAAPADAGERPRSDEQPPVEPDVTDEPDVPVLASGPPVVGAGAPVVAAGPLDAEERRRLEAVVVAGDEATARFVRANLRLVVSIARRFRSTGVPMLDLVQEGNAGLLRAVEKFDHRRGFKFSTYATWWIRQAIARGVAGGRQPIRVPLQAEDDLRLVRRTRDELEGLDGHTPTDEEVATASGLSVDAVRRAASTPVVSASLDEPTAGEGSAALGDLLADPGAEDPEVQALRVDRGDTLARLLAVLDERERAILAMRYGFGGDGEPHAMPEVARAMELSRERVRQIEANALSKLRHPSNEVRPADLLG
ncbi:MAG: sigma-70 family RNA polymerase sigma factor [Acidimicrobiales bacterium]